MKDDKIMPGSSSSRNVAAAIDATEQRGRGGNALAAPCFRPCNSLPGPPRPGAPSPPPWLQPEEGNLQSSEIQRKSERAGGKWEGSGTHPTPIAVLGANPHIPSVPQEMSRPSL